MRRITNLSLLLAALLLGAIGASHALAQASAPAAHETPAAFVHRLYAQYRTKGGQDAVDKNFTDPDFMHLMKENAELFGAEGDADLD